MLTPFGPVDFHPTLIDLGWSDTKALAVKTKINELLEVFSLVQEHLNLYELYPQSLEER